MRPPLPQRLASHPFILLVNRRPARALLGFSCMNREEGSHCPLRSPPQPEVFLSPVLSVLVTSME